MHLIIIKKKSAVAITLFLTIFSISGCKKKSAKNNNKNSKLKTVVNNTTKTTHNTNTIPNNKSLNHREGNLFVRLQLSHLFSIPFIQSKTEKLKIAASKNGFLGNLLRCGTDFTSNISIIAISLPRNFRKTKNGAISMMGEFDPHKLIGCLPKEMGWKKISSSKKEQIFSSGKLKIYVKIPKKGIVMFRTSQWNYLPVESLPKGFAIFSQKKKTMPPFLMGMLNPNVPWKKSPKAVLLGIDANLLNLKLRGILNFEKENDALWFEQSVKKRMVDFITKYNNTKDNKAVMMVKLLKKTGVKRKENLLLSLVKISWEEVSELIKIAKVTITAKQ